MSSHQDPIADPGPERRCRLEGMAPAKALALEMAQTLFETARDALSAYAMTASSVASLAVIAAPHLEMLLRCIFNCLG